MTKKELEEEVLGLKERVDELEKQPIYHPAPTIVIERPGGRPTIVPAVPFKYQYFPTWTNDDTEGRWANQMMASEYS